MVSKSSLGFGLTVTLSLISFSLAAAAFFVALAARRASFLAFFASAFSRFFSVSGFFGSSQMRSGPALIPTRSTSSA